MNVLVYKINRSDDGFSATLGQRMEVDDESYGPVCSISLSGDDLVYSTFYGGLFFHTRKFDAYTRTQDMAFESSTELFEYPLVMAGNVLAMSVKNDVYMYMRDPDGNAWEREDLVLRALATAISRGNLLLASNGEVTAFIMVQCNYIMK